MNGLNTSPCFLSLWSWRYPSLLKAPPQSEHTNESNPYRGYQVLIQTAWGSDFMITITERELQSFPLFVSAVKSKTHGEVIQHASFDNSLWTDMVPKLLLEYP
jgi:hypothetical protein